MVKRLLFAILMLPFCVAIGLISIASFFVWLVRGKGLINVINWLGDRLNKLSK
jgi:hypothetical protein